MSDSYWSNITQRRVGRRRALGITGGFALGAAFLAACGGSENKSGAPSSGGNSSGGSSTSSGLVTDVKDTTSSAKRGGVLKDYAQAEPRSLDPVQPLADLNRMAPFVYSTLLVAKPGKMSAPTGELQGSLAQSWETSPDGLQITFKLRPGVKWHNRPPVNARAFDAQDVLFSIDRYTKLGPLGTLVFNAASPDAPVLSATAPDPSTIVLKLKDPIVYIPNWFAAFGSFTGQIIMYPKEAANNGINLGNDMIGTGPFQLKSHTPSVNFVLERNPDFWDKDAAMFDTIEMPVVQEYAARLAQLKAGNIHYAVSANTLRPEDVLTLKKDEPRILLYKSPFDTTAGTALTFGHLPVGQNKFQDERVRQAVSMSWDRDLYIGSYYNLDKFQQAGLPVDTAWNSHLNFTDSYQAGGWWVDPKGKDFGPNAQYFKYNVADAKKLLSAAGFANGFDVNVRYPASAQYNLEKQTQPLLGFMQDLGLKVKQQAMNDYTQDYIPNNRDAQGNYEGIGIHSVTGGTPTLISAISSLVALHTPTAGVTFNGYDITGKGDKSGDPQLTDILNKAKVEKDVSQQKKLLQDAQRYLGKAMHAMLLPGPATGFWAAWPAVQNFNTWQGGVDETWEHYAMWIDNTKAPLA
jgi:peptide/nickel transport system substrate-binding protein